jgi:hypothetical protein
MRNCAEKIRKAWRISSLAMAGVVLLIVPVVVGVLAAPLWAQLLANQSTAAFHRPAFDAVSVKPNRSADALGYITLRQPGGHVAMIDTSL